MIRVNLLPTDVAETQSHFNPYIIPGVVFAVMFGGIFWDHMRISNKRSALNEEAADLKQKLDRYEPILRQVDELEKQRAALRSRRDVIQQLHNERLRYPKFMDDFLRLLPSNLWLTTLATTIKNDSLAVRIDIQSLDNYAIADLIANLETSQIFGDIILGPVTLSQAVSGPTFGCNVTATYHNATGTGTSAPKKP